MKKPVILTVDDDPQVLSAVERDLRSHFHSDFRIIKAASGVEALEVVQTAQAARRSTGIISG